MKGLTEGIIHNPTARAHAIDVGALVELMVDKKIITHKEYQAAREKVTPAVDGEVAEKRGIEKAKAIDKAKAKARSNDEAREKLRNM